MVLCNFCNKRESRSQPFSEAYVCQECFDDDNNYDFNSNSNKDDLIFVDASNKTYKINSDTELDILNVTDSMNRDNNNITSHDTPIDIGNFKNALLSSLYSQVEFLRSQLEEKDILIRTLLLRDQDVRHYSEQSDGSSETDSTSTTSDDDATAETLTPQMDENGDENSGDTDETLFQELYGHYERDMNENRGRKLEIENQLNEIRKQKHNQYKGLLEGKEKARKPGTNYYKNVQEITDPDEQWPINTILLLGDSMINQI